MRLLLGSGGFGTPDRASLLSEQMQSFFGPIDKLLFVPYALKDHDAYVEGLTARGLHGGLCLDGIHRRADPVKAVEEAEGIYIGGGNTFRLLDALYELNLLDAIRDGVRSGLPYLGISAGTNVACPTMMTTNDMPIVRPPSFEALGLIPFQINVHYFSGRTYVEAGGTFQEHFGETRDDRIAEFHEVNGTPVIGLWEGGILRVEGGQYSLRGAPARLFRRGQPAVDIQPGKPVWPPKDIP